MQFLKQINYADIAYDPKQFLPILETHKVVVIKDYNRDEDAMSFFTQFSDNLGVIHDLNEDLLTGKRTGKRWMEITYDPTIKDKYRASPLAQPLHTDFSYIDIKDNVQFFFCQGKAEKGGRTTFIDTKEIVELLKLAGEDQLLKDLFSTPVTFSKQDQNRTSPLMWEEDGDYHISYNYFCLHPINPSDAFSVVERFHEFLETRVVQSGLVQSTMLDKNDVVFFHDERVLHGRNSYFATHAGQRSLCKGTILLESRKDKNPKYHKYAFI